MAITLSKKVTLLVTIPVVLEIAIIGALSVVLNRVEVARERAAHATEIGNRYNAMLGLQLRRVALIIMRKIADEDSGSTPEEKEIGTKLRAELDQMRELTAASADEKQRWKEVLDLAAELDKELVQAKNAHQSNDRAGARAAWFAAQETLNEVLNLGGELAKKERGTQAEHTREFEEYNSVVKIILVAAILASATVAFASAAFFNRDTAKRLGMLMQNAMFLSAGKPTQLVLSGSDELAALDQVYHQMERDLAELRQRERAILDNTTEMICSLDKHLKLQEFNKATATILGYSDDDIRHKSVLTFVTRAQNDEAYKHLQEAMRTNSQKRFETTMMRADGTLFETDWSATWSEDMRALYCVIRDITDRKQLEQMKKDFVAMLSHDLRTPLSSVLASLELITLPHYGLSQAGVSHLETAEKNLHSSISLINQLLEIEKMESGNLALDRTETSLLAVAERARDTVSSLARSMNIVVVLPATDMKVSADKDKLVRVVTNLLGNALKFSEPSTVIEVKLQHCGSAVRMSVTDQGRGIPAEKTQQIFERFKQVNPADKQEKAGTGLGLAICKAIVEAHEGRIGVDSKVGEGSTFWFELPITPSLEAPLAQQHIQLDN